jgi:septum formation protein
MMAPAPGLLRPHAPAVVLASASQTRRRMLEQAGVPIRSEAAAVDEAAVKLALRAQAAKVEAVAEALAALKAEHVSRRRREALVIGCDQMLDCAGVWFDKPVDRAQAAEQLLALAGRSHRLISAVVVMRDGRRIWQATDTATLTMRPLAPDVVDAYLDAAGAAALASVGGYQLEGLGAQLFTRVEGDFFTVLGLPLLPLLGFLRDHGVLLA